MHLYIFLVSFLALHLVSAQFICLENTEIPFIKGDVLVKEGTRCILSGQMEITGTVRLERDATLLIPGRVLIRGYIRAEAGTVTDIGSRTTVNMQLVFRGGIKNAFQGVAKRGVDLIDTSFELLGNGRVDRIKAVGNSVVQTVGARTFIRQGIQMGGKGSGGNCFVELSGTTVLGGIRIDGCTSPSGNLLSTRDATIRGEIFIQNGIGGVSVQDSNLEQAIMRVNVQAADVVLDKGIYSGLDMNRVGNLFMDKADVRGRITARWVGDDVRITKSNLRGDVMLDDIDNNVLLNGNMLNGITVTVKRTLSSVTLQDNSKFTARILDNGFPPLPSNPFAPITFSNNNEVTSLLFENNQAKITVDNNEIGKITCRNNAQVVGSGNQVQSNQGCPIS